MWTCLNCGHENPDGTLECLCGYRKVSMTGLDEHSSNSSATKTRYSKSGASKFGIVVSIIGIAFGIFLIIMAFFCGRYWSRFRKLYIFWCRFLHIYL